MPVVKGVSMSWGFLGSGYFLLKRHVKFCLSQTLAVSHKHSQETPHGTPLTEGARVGEQGPLFVNAHKLGHVYVVIAYRPTKHWYISPSLLTRR